MTEAIEDREAVAQGDGPSYVPPGIELAWGLIANAYGGNWEKASDEWRVAAERWRDEYMTGKQMHQPEEPASDAGISGNVAPVVFLDRERAREYVEDAMVNLRTAAGLMQEKAGTSVAVGVWVNLLGGLTDVAAALEAILRDADG